MTARVIAITGPAGSGKTAEVLARYRAALSERIPQSTLWLSPTWRAAAAVRDRLMDGALAGCLSPAVMTFDQFAEAVLEASPEPVRPLSRLAKRQLVRLLLDEQLAAGRIRHFLPIARTGGLVDQVCELFSELKRQDVWPDRFRRACQSRGMAEKDAELLAVYAAYQQVLNEHHLYDAEGRFWSARRLLSEGQRRPFERLRLVVVDGFADFTPPQHEILQILAGWVERLLLTLPLEAEPRRTDLFSKPLRTLEELRRRHPGLIEEDVPRPAKPAWPAMAHLEASLFADPRQARPARATTGLEILAASRQLGEIERIGSRVKRLLTTGSEQTGGRPARPCEVAVVFRSVAEVDLLVREVFGKLGIPVAVESSPSLDRSTALAALAGLITLDVEDWPFRRLLAVLSNNYFQPNWPEWQDGLAAVAAERAVRRLQIPRGRQRLLAELRRQAERPTAGHEAPSGHAEERARQAQLALALFARLQEALDRLPRRATLGQWADAWRQLADETGLVLTIEQDEPPADENPQAGPRSRVATTASDRAAWATFEDALRANDKLSKLLGRSPPEPERAEALAALLDLLHSVGVREGLEESGRVRVLSAASARALRIPYLFFAGLAEKSFPPPDRQDRLYSEAEYRGLIDAGLPLVARTERNREEMLLFYEVMTRASRHIWFSYPALDEAAQPLSASPYLEEVELACGRGRIPRTEAPTLSPIPQHDDPVTAAEFRVKAVSTALEGNASLLAGLVHREPSPGLAESLLAGLAVVEARQDRKQFGPTEGMLDGAAARREIAARFGLERIFAATELEQYASCPYQFFLDRVLGLEPLEDLDLSLDYRARGRLVHRGLADFHERVNQHAGGPTSPAALDEEDYRRLLGETFQRLSEHPGRTPLDAAFHEVDLRLWARWADDYRRQHAAYDQQFQDGSVPLRPTWFEVSFGHSRSLAGSLSTDRALELSTPGGVIRIAGRIDRIDTGAVAGQTVFNILDYKTGTSTRFSREAVAEGTALQLPLYALATQQLLLADEEAVPWQAGYWYLAENGFKARQALKMYECRDQRLQPRPEWESTRETVLATVASRVEQMRAARFPVFSADADCTRFCPFQTICRINHVRSLEKTWPPVPDKA
ncbi:MAG: hypothetical protein A2V98_08420 [Planctomycetes bacterium RBG_16_64_12]|nr:MAG: hypothetical protein A2V98_08420 [Planctomycetes bacterium RBG_16_64_12]